MSDQVTEQPGGGDPGAAEFVELPSGDAAFGALMDALGASEDQGQETATEAAEGGAAAPAAAGAGTDGGAGSAGPAGSGTAAEPAADADAAGAAADAADGAAGAAGAAGGAAQQPAAQPGGRDLPADWTATATEYAPKLGELSNKFEEAYTRQHHETSLEEVKKEHARYFEMLEKHPRMLAGVQVPRLDGEEGMETLRDAADAREWQDAVKQLLVAEVRDRTTRALDDERDFLETIHSSIKLFQDNNDLIPGTKDFDVDLANRFATMAKPYELRVEGKLNGYAIPVQPLIDQLRTQLASERAAGAAAAASTPATPPPAPAAPAKDEPPQAGIPSKAGSSAETEDFSTLFGTIGLPNLRI